ncbi:hypothetical protein BDY19DRAFT_721009 [Irpex rosettiformis]|uniref:Uncharacterized protein n=1 Tax=Irpex rosettiformis TaxID=378272 RepID=A0ACB8U8M7_9APHY|nr:hypothetical protein BDY19DRAFT_721009 [Irpex rosettiformis]
MSLVRINLATTIHESDDERCDRERTECGWFFCDRYTRSHGTLLRTCRSRGALFPDTCTRRRRTGAVGCSQVCRGRWFYKFIILCCCKPPLMLGKPLAAMEKTTRRSNLSVSHFQVCHCSPTSQPTEPIPCPIVETDLKLQALNVQLSLILISARHLVR